MDPGAAAQGAPDQPRVGERGLVAQLGVVQRCEVVHRDDCGRARVGGTKKFVPCTTSMAPMNHSNGGRSRSGPQRVQGAGRHGPLVRGDAVREACLDAAGGGAS